MKATSRSRPSPLTCSCLHNHIAVDGSLVKKVSRAVCTFMHKSRRDRIATVVSWIKYADLISEGHRKRMFILPLEADAQDVTDNPPPQAVMTSQLICQSTLMRLLNIGPAAWETCSLAALTSHIPDHGLTGKSNRHPGGEEIKESISAFFDELTEFACPPRATRFARTEVGYELREEDDEMLELPSSWSKRSVFGNWMGERGWTVKTDAVGKMKILEKEGVPAADWRPYCSLPFFLRYWKTKFPKIIVPKSREDICGDCFVFMYRHRYLFKKQRSADSDNKENAFDSSDEEELDQDIEEAEALIEKAYRHMDKARWQRALFNKKSELAKIHAVCNKPHGTHCYTLVADFCQNMALPHFGSEQPGETYYLSPLAIYCFGLVDPTTNKLYAHLYDEGQGKKGGNNVASLLIKTLKQLNMLREDETGGELNIVMDNCGGQNKNRMVLRLALYLVEIGAFKNVNLIFLVRGHTKNLCDGMFNQLKQLYHISNIYTFPMLVETLTSGNVEVLPVADGDFEDWDTFLNNFYLQFVSGTVQCNHIFNVERRRVTQDCVTVWCETEMLMYEADQRAPPTIRDFKRDKQTLEPRRAAMRTLSRLKIAFPDGLKEIKMVELFIKWQPYIPAEYKDIICPPVNEEMIA